MAQSYEVLEYLRMKYKLYSPRKPQIDERDDWDPWVNPDEGYIPFCSSCEQVYDVYKRAQIYAAECEMDHLPSCLWHDYFVGKIKKVNSKVVIVYKKSNGVKSS